MVKTPRNIPEPAKLVLNRTKWTSRYRRILAGAGSGEWATRDAKKTLSAALYRLAHGKCVFCESPLGVSGHLEVEHYTAKTLYPDLTFEWTNLLPTCRLCNRSKSNVDHGNALAEAGRRRSGAILLDSPRYRPSPAAPPIECRSRAARTAGQLKSAIFNALRLCTKRCGDAEPGGRWLELLASSRGRKYRSGGGVGIPLPSDDGIQVCDSSRAEAAWTGCALGA